MDALLTGSIKEDGRCALGVSLGIDMSKLDVCFGGFAPTVMGDLLSTCERAAESEERFRQRREAALAAADLDAARESEVHQWTDGEGAIWDHVVLDDARIRIKGCATDGAILHVPAAIDGYPVVEVAPAACAQLESVRELFVPDSVLIIGDGAFRGCTQLERAHLPAYVSEYRPDWFRYCTKLAHLELPGALEVLTPRIFDQGALKSLVIGEGTRDVQPGTFINSKLESVHVVGANPFMASDGLALYSEDHAVMAALAVPVAAYEVHPACKVVGKKAFSAFCCLEEARLPEGLEVIGEFAFAGTSLEAFTAPDGLRAILEKAFYGCRCLQHAHLNEGLEILGESAFADAGIEALRVPSSVREIGPHVADGTRVRFSGADATFAIAGTGGTLLFDGAGGLYEMRDEGMRFVRLMDPEASSYRVLDGTASLGRQAFECARVLKRVELPDGLERIEGAAFRGCMELSQVNVPESVIWIGGDAFLDTLIEEVVLSGSLEHLGPRALVTLGAHHGAGAPTLARISIAGPSKRFRMHEGVLLERKEDGAERAVLYVGPDEIVHLPETVDEVCAYAFNGSTTIKEMFLSDRIVHVGVRGLAVDAPLEHIHVDMMEPHEGHASFDIYPPCTDRSEQQMMLALTVPAFVNVEALFEHYDNAIINASSFDAMSESGLGVYEQAVRLIERLEDPVFMGAVRQDMARRVLADGLANIAREMARHDDRASLGRLADLGVLTSENIDGVIESVQCVRDASVTGHLLEMKRKRFGKRAFDLSL